MKLKFFLTIPFALIFTMMIMVGCASSSSDDSSSNGASESEEQVKVIIDAEGRTVKLPEEVNTVATVGTAARIVVYAGAQDKLVAVSEMDKSRTVNMPYSIAAADTFASLPTTTSENHVTLANTDVDLLIDLNPDVIVSNASADECDALQEATNIPVIGVFYQNQLFTTNVINSIECVGEALGTESHAQAIIAKLESWRDDLAARTSNLPLEDEPLAYFGAVAFLEGRSWNDSYANYAPANSAHVRNAANEIASDGHIAVTLDDIVAWNPDYLFINEVDYESFKQAYDDNREVFDELNAFKNNRIYTQPFYNCNGTNGCTGICEAYFIAATVYPEAFSDVDLEAVYTDVYTTMLNGFDFYAYMKSNGVTFGAFPSLQ